jgi:hypothetical protein
MLSRFADRTTPNLLPIRKRVLLRFMSQTFGSLSLVPGWNDV